MQADILGPDFRVETFSLPPDSEGSVVATLVTLAPARPNGRAVLHVHGFADYFFHAEQARWWAERGYTFYALDLRKYGRSLREHQTPNYVADLHEYYGEIDLAWWRITERDGHDEVVASGHSTGGLTMALWADERRPAGLVALVLNAPWFDMHGPAWLRSPAARLAIERIGSSRPLQEIPRKVSGVYGRSLHRDHGGEWDYDLSWKPIESRPVHVGWLRAIRRGHTRLHAGLGVRCPVLVLSSARSFFGDVDGEAAATHDIVLDVEQIRRWASSVGPHVTSIAIEGAIHDVLLSRPPVRAAAYDVIGRWLDAWVASPAPVGSGQEDHQGAHADDGDHHA
ncbi:alpha/beta hydrolase [Nocardioides hwasunensis]|uniref:Alpha/beta hydrolase n=1 Tax=Nocardioides hwasunensis TaxID=397258 RepID=A0ABR8MEN6_9ACTN|nr:alpha/beta hydrolase [Nocardioides hwasunensis]